MRFQLISILLAMYFSVTAQDTFSIVAVDTETGEVGSAGATCLDTVLEGVSAIIISDVIPGLGAIHTQSFWDPANQINARGYMLMGLSAEEILDSVTANDVAGNPAIRQYGVALINDSGDPERAAFTGANCMDWKGHFLGPDYAVQGNILSGEPIIDSMATRFFFAEGDLADKLMAAMQGAKKPGADSRCLTPQNTSSRSAFIRVAKPDDSTSFFLDIVIGATGFGVEPIDELQAAFDEWRDDNPTPPPPSGLSDPQFANLEILIKPNPAGPGARLELNGTKDINTDLNIRLFDMQGRGINSFMWKESSVALSQFNLTDGHYIVVVEADNRVIKRMPFSWKN